MEYLNSPYVKNDHAFLVTLVAIAVSVLFLAMRYGVKQKGKTLPNERKPDEEYQPLVGIQFSHIVGVFIPECGGAHALDGLTTTQVIERFILPKTLECKESYCDYLERAHHPAFGSTACAFVSHAHKYKFLDLIFALETELKKQPQGLNSYIFLDLFCINQHRREWTFEFLSTTFRSSIAKFGTTIMVMSPWNSPLPYTRTWCVYEAYCTIVSNATFTIALSPNDKREFLEQVKCDPQAVVAAMLATIQSSKSESFLERDKEQNFAIIRKSVGFSRLDALVFSLYRTWVIETIRQAIMASETDKMENFKLSQALGLLQKDQGNLDDSLQTLLSSYDMAKQEFGPSSDAFTVSMLNLGLVYYDLGRYQESRQLLKDCLGKCQKHLSATHPGTIKAMKALAMVYRKEEDLDNAAHMYETCLLKEQCFANIGRNHRNTLTTMNNLALVYRDQRKEDKSLRLFQQCLKKAGDTLGRKHPMAMTALCNIGILYYRQGKLELAQVAFEHCLTVRQSILGAQHPDTRHSRGLLAKLYHEQGHSGKAQRLLTGDLQVKLEE